MAKKNLATKLTMENLAVVLKDTFAYAEDLPTKVSELTNDSNYQTGAQVEASINAKIASVYKPGPSVAFENLPALTAANEGFVYNITNAFTTTADFVEGAGKKHKAGADVGIVNVGTAETPEYKYNVFANFTDLSGYMEKIAGGTADALVKQDANGQVVDTGIAAADIVTKVTGGTTGNIAVLDANGKIADGGKAPSDFALRDTDATANNIAKFDSNGDPVDAGIAADDIVTKVTGGTTGNVAALDANGKIVDGGIAANKILTEDDIEDYTVAEIRALLARNTSGE